MPDEKVDEVKTEVENPVENQKPEEEKKPEPLKVEVGEEYFRFDTTKMQFQKYRVEIVDNEGNFLLSENGKFVGLVFTSDEKQCAYFRENYKKDKEKVKKPAMKMIDEKIAGLSEIRKKIKLG